MTMVNVKRRKYWDIIFDTDKLGSAGTIHGHTPTSIGQSWYHPESRIIKRDALIQTKPNQNEASRDEEVNVIEEIMDGILL